MPSITEYSSPACCGSTLGSNLDFKMGDRGKGVANTLSPAKKYTQKRVLLNDPAPGSRFDVSQRGSS
jgi:hypothetical protein